MKYYLIVVLLIIVAGYSYAQPQIRIVKPNEEGKFVIEYKKDIIGDEELYLVAPSGYEEYLNDSLVKFVTSSDDVNIHGYKFVRIPYANDKTNIDGVRFYSITGGENIYRKTKNFIESNSLVFPNKAYKTGFFAFNTNNKLQYLKFERLNYIDEFSVYFDPGFLNVRLQKGYENVDILSNDTGWQIPIQNDTIIGIPDSMTSNYFTETLLIGKIELTSTFKKLVDTITINVIEKDEGNYTFSLFDGNKTSVINSGDKLIIQTESSSFISIHLNLADVIKKEISSSNIDTDSLILKYKIPDFQFQVSDGIYLDKTYSVKGNVGRLVILNNMDSGLFIQIANLYNKVPFWVPYIVLVLVLILLFVFRKKLVKLFKRISIGRKDEQTEIEADAQNELLNETDNIKSITHEISLITNDLEDSKRINELMLEIEYVVDELKTYNTELLSKEITSSVQVNKFREEVLSLDAVQLELENKLSSKEKLVYENDQKIKSLTATLSNLNSEYSKLRNIFEIKNNELVKVRNYILNLKSEIKLLEDKLNFDHYREIEKLKYNHKEEISIYSKKMHLLENSSKEYLPYYYTNVLATLKSVVSIYRTIQRTAKSSRTGFYRELIDVVLGDRNDNGLLAVLSRLEDKEALKIKIPAFGSIGNLTVEDNNVKNELLKILVGNSNKSFINKIAISYAYISSKESYMYKLLLEQNINKELMREAYILLSNCLMENFILKLTIPNLFKDIFEKGSHIKDLNNNKFIEYVSHPDIHKSITAAEKDTIYDIVVVGFECRLLNEINSKPVVVTK